MTDQETIRAILTKAGVKLYEDGGTSITIVSEYHNVGDPSQCISTLFEFNDDGSLITCRAFRCEDY